MTAATAQPHWWCRVECDARLVRRKLARRKGGMDYVITGWGEQAMKHWRMLSTVVLVGQIAAPTREAALSQIIRDCPGGVVTICKETSPTPPTGRFAGLRPFIAWQPLVTAEKLAAAEEQLRQIEARTTAHEHWMAENKRKGYTDDKAAVELERTFPWPSVRPAYTFTKLPTPPWRKK